MGLRPGRAVEADTEEDARVRLQRLARWCYRRRRAVVAIWLLTLVVLGTSAAAAGGKLTSKFTVSGVESQRALDLLTERFPEMSGDTASIVFKADKGVEDPDVRGRMERLFTQVASVGNVLAVISPYEPGIPSISPDGKIGFATVQFDVGGSEVPRHIVKELQSLREEAQRPGLQIELGGAAIQFVEQQELSGHEELGLIAAAFILLITFGSVIAMGLPLITAVFALGIGMSVLWLATHLFEVPATAPQLASMIGLGIGIDYALFILTRYRQALQEKASPEDAVVMAINTSGRAVVFASMTVAISLLGMLVMDISFVRGMVLATVLIVVIVVLASLTLLPAVLGFAGNSIDRLRLPGLGSDKKALRETVWFRWSRLVQRHPWRSATAGLAVMIVLALPAFSVRLGTIDAGNDPTSRSTRRSYDLLSEGFGPGFNGPLLLVAELQDPQDATALEVLRTRLLETSGIVPFVPPPQVSAQGDAAVMTVFPTTAPQDEATDKLINKLRNETIPAATQGTGVDVMVSGITALYIDMGHAFSDKLPLFIGSVIGLSFLLLMAVYRSILIPLKAAIMNLLSVSAAAGVIVAVFQWGWLKDVVGIDRTGPIESFLPMFLFAVLFGLSMDYEVFLLSSVREQWLRTGDNSMAVADGLATTARVITAAAAIMVTVFGSFVLTDARLLKMAGLGLACAILIDATLLRMVLAPAALELIGDANWWFPRWLDRIVPNIAMEPDDVDRRRTPRAKNYSPGEAPSGNGNHTDSDDADDTLTSPAGVGS